MLEDVAHKEIDGASDHTFGIFYDSDIHWHNDPLLDMQSNGLLDVFRVDLC